MSVQPISTQALPNPPGLTVPPDRPWFAFYPPGVPHEIALPITMTLNDVFERSVRSYADLPVLDSFGVKLTYAQVGMTATAIAAWLQQRGLKPGDRVAIMMPNIAAYFPVVFGILKAGCILVNVNPLYTASELRHQLTDSGSKAIFVVAQFEHTVKAAMVGTPLETVVRVKLGDLLGFKGYLVTYFGGRKSPIRSGGQVTDAVDFATVVAKGGHLPFTPVAVSPGISPSSSTPAARPASPRARR